MPKFRKKPVVIEAVQFNKIGDHPSVVDDASSPTGYGIHTFGNVYSKHEVALGDWVVTGLDGEVYAIKDETFLATYDPA